MAGRIITDGVRSDRYRAFAKRQLAKLKGGKKTLSVDGFTIRMKDNKAHITAPDGLVVVRCNGVHVYTYFAESLTAPRFFSAGLVHVANQPNTYWPDAPVAPADSFNPYPSDFRDDWYDNLFGQEVTTRQIEYLTGPVTGPVDPNWSPWFVGWSPVNGWPVVLPPTPVVRQYSGEVVSFGTLGIEIDGRLNADGVTSLYGNSTRSTGKRYGRAWKLDNWGMSQGHLYSKPVAFTPFTGFIKPLMPNAGWAGHRIGTGANAFMVKSVFSHRSFSWGNTYAISELSYSDWIATDPVVALLWYEDNYDEEVLIINEGNSSAEIHWGSMLSLVREYLSADSRDSDITDDEITYFIECALRSSVSLFGMLGNPVPADATQFTATWFLGHDDAFHFWSRVTGDSVFSFHNDWFSMFYVAMPAVVASSDVVRPTIVWSGIDAVYTCVSDEITVVGNTCVGLAVGSPFIGWRELTLPVGTTLYAKPTRVVTDPSTGEAAMVEFLCIVNITDDTGPVTTVQRLAYTLADDTHVHTILGTLPLEDTEYSTWDLIIFGTGPLALAMSKMPFRNIMTSQTWMLDPSEALLPAEYNQFLPYPEIFTASYP